MRRLPASPLKIAVLATAVLGGVLLGQAIDSPAAAYAAVHGTAGAAAAAAAVAMASRGTFASRLAAGIVTAASGVVALVTMMLGTPGGAPSGITLAGTTLVACGLLVPALLVAHAGPVRSGGDGDRPYAP